MIDMHSHIIYGVDDGSKNKEMTLEMLKLSIGCGVKKIVATPHYMKGRFVVEYGEIKDKVNELRQIIKNEALDIEIYCGQEVYYRENILEYYEEGAIGTINDSRYMLIELPMREFDVNNVIDNLYELTLKGIVPIIAHPERYMPFIKNFIKEGYLFQLNTGSIVGDFGKEVKKLALNYLGNGVYYICGSDAHSDGKRNTHISEDCLEILSNYKDEFIKNGQLILDDKEVKRKINLIKERKKLFGIF